MLETRTMLSAGPVIAGLGPIVNYTEGAPPAIVAGHATVTESAGAFASSTLNVKTTNGSPGDQLGILNGNGVGVGPNGAVMFAASPTAIPVQIGTVTGGQGNVPLVVSFNTKATQGSVQAVVNQIGYGNGTSTFAIPDRTISFQLTDGKSVAGASVTKSIHVIPAPVITDVGMPPAYKEGAPPIFVAPHAKIGDAPNAYANSSLSIKTLNAMPGDQSGIVKGLGVDLGPNGAVLFKASPTATAVTIGTVTGGTGTAPLMIVFNGNATKESVQAVLNQVVYGNGQSTLPTPDRQIGIVFTDGNRVSSVPVIAVIHVDPAPVIGNLASGPVNYKVNANPVALAPSATIADAAGAYFNSSLSVQLSGGTAGDQLGIHASGALSLGTNGTMLFNGVAIGTFSGGSGAAALVIKFNAAASRDSVQAVLNGITFAYHTTSTTPVLSDRMVTFNFVDGNKVAAAFRVEGIHVTK